MSRSGVEFIGFLISLIALIFLFFKNRGETLKKLEKEIKENNENSPPEPPKRQLYKSSEIKPMQIKHNSLSQLEDYRLKSSIESRQLKSDIEMRRLKTSVESRHLKTSIRGMDHRHEELEKRKPSRASKMLTKLPEVSDIIIYDTILNKPKGW